jgi:hypothetical protein
VARPRTPIRPPLGGRPFVGADRTNRGLRPREAAELGGSAAASVRSAPARGGYATTPANRVQWHRSRV